MRPSSPSWSAGVPHLIGLRERDRRVEARAPRDGGLGVDILATETWANDWTSITAFVQKRPRPLPRLQRTGKTWTERMHADGAGSATLWGGTSNRLDMIG